MRVKHMDTEQLEAELVRARHRLTRDHGISSTLGRRSAGEQRYSNIYTRLMLRGERRPIKAKYRFS